MQTAPSNRGLFCVCTIRGRIQASPRGGFFKFVNSMKALIGGRVVHIGRMESLAVLLMAFSAAAQGPYAVPSFNSDTIRPHGRLTKILAPGMVLELWGRNLAPPGCERDPIPKDSPPLELCGVRVLIGSRPAELLYVSSYQINLKIPSDVPPEGVSEFRVCAGNVCSDAVRMLFSARTALLSLEQPAYVHMPVWIDVDAPEPYAATYPCGLWPWRFQGYEFEVSRNGERLAPVRQPSQPANGRGDRGQPCDGSSTSRFPLHLLYHFDEPGTYSVRFTAMKDSEILYQSEWTDIRVEPYSEDKREEWLRSLDAKAGNGRSAGEIVSSLLAWPDSRALAVLLKLIPRDISQCTNYDCMRIAFGRAALAGFDDGLLQREIPRERLIQLCPPDGKCK